MTQYRFNNKSLLHPVALTEHEDFLLKESSTFCMYPWVHLNLDPNGDAKPCCAAEWRDVKPLGNANQQSMKEIWNSSEMKQLRSDMLTETPNKRCMRCYEKEQSGFFSSRNKANKYHGHHIDRVHETQPDGALERFEMVYWDIRFSNLCNLRCRSCGHPFSSQWYQDQITLYPEYARDHKPLIFSGRHKTDIWEQLISHIDYVENIYFAGGEPLIMDEHYRILEELERREMFGVRLYYNTNFTQVRLKDRLVFDYWKKFKNISVGASLDAMGPVGEYMRKGCRWTEIEENRRRMQEICPNVDFYISPTLSIMNAWHLPDFHRDWVKRGFIQPQDLDVNLLQNPPHYRLDIAPQSYKQQIQEKFQQHLEWLRPLDPLQRATSGFESAIKFMMATDNSHLIPTFWSRTQQLDGLRHEHLLEVIPELETLL